MLHEILYAIFHVVWLIYHTLGMIYESLLLIGAIGLAAQALLGFAHFGAGGAGHHAAGAVASHHAGHLPSTAHGQVAGGAAAHGGSGAATARPATAAVGRGGATTSGQRAAALWALFSPLTIFSFLLGVGAVGMLVHGYLSESWAAVVALGGGVLFYAALVKPLWRLILQFASRPAETLAGTVASEAVAMSRFDGQGKGVVRVTVDGQLVRLLAYLERDDREKGVTVGPGDSLVVTSIDGKRNTCRVTRL